MADLNVGADLYAGGNMISLGLGGKLPISDHFLAGATVSFARKHDNYAMTKDEIMSQTTPVVFDGANIIQNTLLTRIEYGLSYRF